MFFSVDVPFQDVPSVAAGLVFVNALEVDQLPEAEIQISGPLRLEEWMTGGTTIAISRIITARNSHVRINLIYANIGLLL